MSVNIHITRTSDMRVVTRTDQSIDAGGAATLSFPTDEPTENRLQITAHETNTGGETTVRIDETDVVHASLRPDGVSIGTQ